MTDQNSNARTAGRDFLRQIIDRDLAEGRCPGDVVTRFPPEPNGFLHIGHAKSILLNFGIAEEYGGRCHLRFDDTNPITEEHAYAEAIREDVRWLGFDWGEHLYHAADYFDRMYEYAERLIGQGKAYVDSQLEEEIREGRGTVTEPGTESPFRDRSVEENLDLFRRMKAGEFGDGEHVLRARIDMSSPNMLMRDPILYRIRHAGHYRTGDAWCIYPLYDYAHCLEDAIEGVTHSFCTLEFANNRELYDWILDELGFEEPRPHQYEFARGVVDYTVMSKRKLLLLVKEGRVQGWDDPRMPTLAGFRRRGVPPSAILAFWKMVGVARSDSRVDIGKLEFSVRDELNMSCPRVLAVLDPLKVTITDWPEGATREIEAPCFPHDVPLEGSRPLTFSRDLRIDRSDFAEDPPPGFRRLVPGGEVRLRYGCVIRCDEVVKDAQGRVVELRCTHDPETWGGNTPDGRRVKGTVQWVSADTAAPCEVRLYDRLFSVADPETEAADRGEEGDFRDFLNPESLKVVKGALVEPSVVEDASDTRYQFERLGYFWRDPVDGVGDTLIFNRIVTLRDTWSTRSDSPASGSGPGAGSREAEPSKHVTAEEPGTGSADGGASRPEPSPEVAARATSLIERFGIGPVDAEILARDPGLVVFFAETVEALTGALDRKSYDGPSAALAANWIINDLPPVVGEQDPEKFRFGPTELAALLALMETDVVSSRGAGEVLEALAREGGDPAEIVERLDLAQVSDEETLASVVFEVLESNPEKVESYRGGRTGLMGFFMGQVMRHTDGRADPELARALILERLT
jgi:glutaminyl-tRNA synthetase